VKIRTAKKSIVIHLVPGYVTVEDLQLFKEAGATICAWLRHPLPEMNSLEKLPTNPEAGSPEDVKNGFIKYTWENLETFSEHDLIDHAIDARFYCGNNHKHEEYRKQCFTELGLPYHEGITLPRHCGEEFYTNCDITRTFPRDNPWNGEAAGSETLHPDNRYGDTAKCTAWQASFLAYAYTVYTQLLAKKGIK
jgi:hypothetical protein